jgi:hypothetical protein
VQAHEQRARKCIVMGMQLVVASCRSYECQLVFAVPTPGIEVKEVITVGICLNPHAAMTMLDDGDCEVGGCSDNEIKLQAHAYSSGLHTACVLCE